MPRTFTEIELCVAVSDPSKGPVAALHAVGVKPGLLLRLTNVTATPCPKRTGDWLIGADAEVVNEAKVSP